MAIKVSVVCTNYNKGPWLSEALDSFLAQKTDFPIEIIVIDDASTDESSNVIQTYQGNYPDKIRALFNPTNLGITRTWIKACQEAQGQYIARCDGDDCWIDVEKLAKQVAALDHSTDSLWSNTDFNMVDEQGNLLEADVLKRELIPFMDSYEKMLALKGMTMSSTWLVDRQLMLEVNQLINPAATDDTFDMQLELFRRTRLTFLDDVTTVYRMVTESDSRSQQEDKLIRRLDGLYRTQCHYLEKYPDQDLLAIARLQAKQDANQEHRIFTLNRQINGLQAHVNELEQVVAGKTAEAAYYQKFYEETLDAYNRVITSRRWTIPTKLLAFFRRKK